MALARSRKFISALLVIYELVYPIGENRTLLLILRDETFIMNYIVNLLESDYVFGYEFICNPRVFKIFKFLVKIEIFYVYSEVPSVVSGHS